MEKLYEILGLAQYEAEKISSSPRDWLHYLDTASQLYRYSFSDTLLIHAQRPGATACAELEIWNHKMKRWVNRGAKGIALIDDRYPKKRLRYVLLWSSIFVTLMANKIGGLQFGIYRNCQISSRVFHTAVAALPLTKANRSDFE